MTWLAPARQWALLIALSAAVAALLLGLHAPAALMLGPLGSAMLLASGGLRVRFPLPLFVVSQGVIGCLIAKMVPLTIVGDILQHWLLFTAGVLFVVAASSLLGWLMTRLEILPGTTALWGTSAGAASIMTIMAESYGADIRLVAVMQYLRVVLVAGVAALVARLFGVSTVQAAAPLVWFPHVHWLPFLETMALAIAGPLLARSLRIPAGAFLVPMIAGIVLTHFGLMTIELPTWLLAGCYALVGWNVGLRFTRPLLVHAARALPKILGCTVLLIALCGLVAVMLVHGAGVDPLTAYLATSPGGSDSIAIIAASTNVDVSFVMAMQTVRMIAVLFLAPILTKFIAERLRPSDDLPS
ncbi:MAG: AbrB family transcriptional regulator [Alphaproteobacteria bacterium]|nr:AbrB family transcriptional regulator [Alphaproteobacteria bacterium]MBV8406015.1 AbrB family transcriptional regulator [Alphaproteobacteria bacterium]